MRVQLENLWPALTPRRLLDELFADQARLTAAAPALTAAERAALVREPGGWSSADVPLLDEAAELLGRDERDERARSDRAHAQRIAYAQGVLDIAAGSIAKRPPLPASSTPPHWPHAMRRRITAPWPSGPPPIAPGRSGT